VVSVIAAEVGENVRAGQPILMVEAAGKQWLSFNVREDHLNRLSMGETASVMRNGTDGATRAVITELRPLGTFATWQAERVIGDHDRNTLRLRLDPEGQPAGLEPGMTVWIDRELERTRALQNRFARRSDNQLADLIPHRRPDFDPFEPRACCLRMNGRFALTAVICKSNVMEHST
jgi:HlyD family secretion protein